ncbi:MAG: hypothetical protein UY92_C0014G0066 [Candidatus Magasanikbacteria bacterium GW2011_GWA2_56_11]|uniref:DUF4440 domain-containing protein n=1 Tax=Candidatus Magasanikbacteria bacterium GW2011_GWA2_56_11 TaxID=1619044 RepID=A0A0G1YEU7_9BACT|nr:MAG: hypothetical protein UY92_C0014G0066 [Candidatus Magasanikbacteria bacterium GW2011_GWA2_56_11]
MDDQLAKQIEDLELSLLRPEVRRSAKKIKELLADDFVEFGMFGKQYTKLDFVETLPNSEEEKFEKYDASDFAAREIAPDTVLLTYAATIEFLKTNEKIFTLRSSIWQKRSGKWQMIFHQGTVILKGQGRLYAQ